MSYPITVRKLSKAKVLDALHEAMVKSARPLKPLLSRTLWPQGAIRTIVFGPCKGLRYRIFPDMGLSPLHGGWEKSAQALILKHVKRGHIVYDLGANYGIHALLFAKLVQDSGHVYAFEPQPNILDELEANVALNNFTNVTCLPFAVSDQEGFSDFSGGHHVGAGHLSAVGDARGDHSRVPCTTLDHFVFEAKHKPPDLIKVDIEGAEAKALTGATTVLKRCRPLVLIDLHNPDQDLQVGRILADCEYTAYRTEDGSRVDDLSKGWPHADGLWGQVLAVPNASADVY